MAEAKYIQIAELFKRRILSGDYEFSSIPGAQRLAAEVGVSYLTARQAVQRLIDEKVLERQDTGRLKITDGGIRKGTGLKVALVTGDITGLWPGAICRAVEKLSCSFRVITYGHDDDPVLYEALNGDFDLIFLQFNNNDRLFIEKIVQLKHKVVTLFHDLTRFGIRCVDGTSPHAIRKLMEYMVGLGHRRIDCLCTEPYSQTTAIRMKEWDLSRKSVGFDGNLHHLPVKNFNPSIVPAYEHMKQIIKTGKMDFTGLFSISSESAMGIMRACYEHNIIVGKDLSLCSFGNPETAMMLIPSLTIVTGPSPEPRIEAVIKQQMGLSDEPERLMFRPPGEPLWIGESTGRRVSCDAHRELIHTS